MPLRPETTCSLRKLVRAGPEQTLELLFAQLEGKCYCCGKPGHSSEKCFKRDTIPKDDWAINKAIANDKEQKEQSHVQQQTNKESVMVWHG